MNVNKAIIVGRLTRDPESRTLPSGQSVSAFGVATSRNWTNRETNEKQERTEYHNIVAFGRLAEICNQYLTKGQQIFIEGRLETRTWEGQDGNRRNRTEIIAENMQMGMRPQGVPRPEGPKEEEKMPTVEVGESKKKTKKPASAEVSTDEQEVKVEDIPF